MSRIQTSTPLRSGLSHLACLCALALTAVAASPARASEVEKGIDRSFDAAAIREVRIENLVGEMTLVGGSGSAVRVTGTIHADRSAGESAAQLAESLQVQFETLGDRLVIRAVYPTGDHRRYYYPRTAHEESDVPAFLDWFGGSGTSTRYQDVQVRVVGSSSSGAAALWADFRVELPAGVAIQAKNAVGVLRSQGVNGDQTLDTSAGAVDAREGRGRLSIDTGSGDVKVSDHEGDVAADTGSGDVRMLGVRGGRLVADTGSGDVEYVGCQGSIDADTGSGDVTGRDLVVGSRFRADTGSGDVRVAGDFSAVRNLFVDTGSGDVLLTMSAVPSVRLRVSTGSGDIDLDVADVRIRSIRHGDLIADLGSGDGEGTIDTGSGDVRLRSSN